MPIRTPPQNPHDLGRHDIPDILRTIHAEVRERFGERIAELAATAEGGPVDVSLSNSGNLPRIAPSRIGGELRWERGPLHASLGAVRYARQDDVAAFETPTPGYTLVDTHISWHVDTESGNGWELFLDGRNLLDEDARVHTSPLKDLAPLPGRGVTVGVRAYF